MVSSKVLFSLLFLFLLRVESQSINFGLDTFTPHSQLVRYERDAFVPPDKPFVRMTAVDGLDRPRGSSVGRVIYNRPWIMWYVGSAASFDTTITLEIEPAGPYNPAATGHGITFFIVPTNSTRPTGGIGENLGIYDAVAPGTPVFTVEFDLSGGGNSNPPYSHIGININNQVSQNLSRADDMVFRRLTARITYDVPTKLVSVVATYGRTTVRTSYVFNFAGIFPQSVNLGLSASTGPGRVAFLDVYSWHFNSTVVPDPIVPLNTADNIKPYAV